MSENDIIIEENENEDLGKGSECKPLDNIIIKDKKPTYSSSNSVHNSCKQISKRNGSVNNRLRLKISEERGNIKNNIRTLSYSSKNVYDNEEKDQKDKKSITDELEILKNKLNEEKVKNDILKVIAEEEKKKHYLYRQRFQDLKKKNDELIEKIKNKKKKNSSRHKENNCKSSSNLEIIKETLTFNIKNGNSANNSIELTEVKSWKDKIKTIEDLNAKNEELTKELNKVNEENNNKGALIKKLYKKIEELQEVKNTLNSQIQKLSREIKLLNQELKLKNSKIDITKNLLIDEKKTNEQNYKKIAQLLNINEQLEKDYKILREQNKKISKQNNEIKINDVKRNSLKIKKKENEKIIIEAKNVNLSDDSFDISDRSLRINKMKDISDISAIPQNKQQMDGDDVTLNELRIFEKNDSENISKKKEQKKENNNKKYRKKYESSSSSSSSDSEQ